MKLHANAALSLKGRRELCRRVVSGERTLSEAAEAAEVSVRCALNGRPGIEPRETLGYSIVPRRRIRFRIAPANDGSRRSQRSDGCGSPVLRSPSAWGWRCRRCLGS
jgi:leucine-zipper of insertion element IS481